MEIGVILGLAILIIFLVSAIFALGKNDFYFLADKMADRSRRQFGVVKPCPLCGSMLEKGEKVRTKVFTVENPGKKQAMGITDSLVHMYGCQYCDPRDRLADPEPEPNVIPGPGHPVHSRPRRICPVCSQELGSKDHVVARLFEQDNKKPHLHVIGCTRCRK